MALCVIEMTATVNQYTTKLRLGQSDDKQEGEMRALSARPAVYTEREAADDRRGRMLVVRFLCRSHSLFQGRRPW